MSHFQAAKMMATSAVVFAMTAGSAVAQSRGDRWSSWRDRLSGSRTTRPDRETVSQVPEIDASAGLLALAAVAAAMVLVWELRRRKARA